MHGEAGDRRRLGQRQLARSDSDLLKTRLGPAVQPFMGNDVVQHRQRLDRAAPPGAGSTEEPVGITNPALGQPGPRLAN